MTDTPEPTMTDRTIRTSEDLARLDFAKGEGLLPVVVQDATSGDTLMLAYADRDALERTLSTSEMHFRSRSRGAPWRKGETSGNTMAVVSLHADCDADAVLARVRPAGPACHTGQRSCFGERSGPAVADTQTAADIAALAPLARLAATVDARAGRRPEGSYTTRLLGDANLRYKKLGEETAELIAALATERRDRVVEESADLVYHLLVALRAADVTLADVAQELEQRAGS